MKKKFLYTVIILFLIVFLIILVKSAGTYRVVEDIEEAVTLQIQSVAQAVSAMEKIFVKAEGQESDRENEILGITDETSEWEELENGRLPGEMQYDERRVYDPDDTIYHKTYYDDFTQGLIMGIDYYPKVSMEKELEDYFKEGTESRPLDYLVSMFYDNRTIEIDESELWELFVSHGYDICFHHAEFSEYELRIVEIMDRDGLSLYPVRILMQTWDNDFIYLQDITGPIPRKIRELMMVDRDGVWQMIMHSSGFSRDFVAEEELIFWEFTGTYWILVPMELEIDTRHAHNMGNSYPNLDRDELFEAIYYRDGIAFRTSMQATNKWGDKYAVRLGIMEEVEKNKEFVLKGVMEQFGETKEIWYSDCCIQFKIVDKEEESNGQVSEGES